MAQKTIVRYSENPFSADGNLLIPVKNQSVKLSRLGKDDNVLINEATGEVQGTHVTTYRKVDAERFVKLFAQNVALTFDLTAAGIKAFNVLIWMVQEKGIERDLIPLDKFVVEDFLKDQNKGREKSLKLSMPTFWRGLSELEDVKIIAKHVRKGWYFINPNFCFNGDRLAFTTVIEKKTDNSKSTPVPKNTEFLDTTDENQQIHLEEKTEGYGHPAQRKRIS